MKSKTLKQDGGKFWEWVSSMNSLLKAVGTIRVDEVYAVAPPQPGKKIA
jgi:hypothetical protein